MIAMKLQPQNPTPGVLNHQPAIRPITPAEILECLALVMMSIPRDNLLGPRHHPDPAIKAWDKINELKGRL